MTFAAVKMDCFHPRATVLKTSSDRNMLRLGPEWLVYQVRPGQNGILLSYNEETQRHELPMSPTR